MAKKLNRRKFISRSVISTVGAAVGMSFEEKALLAKPSKQLKQSLSDFPRGKIGDVEMTRLIVGGNLTSGFAHSRDLIYVSSLLKNYFTDEKIFETWQLCEENGVNTAILRLDNTVLRLINKYWHEIGGNIQWLAQIKITEKDLTTQAMKAIDNGAIGAYIHGGIGDKFVSENKIELLGKALDFIKQNKVIGGLAGHSLAVPITCEKQGLNPDFYMKTFNSGNYWTAGPKLERDPNWTPNPEQIVEPEFMANKHDNIWSVTPQQTAEFMQKINKPWIAYKVLGAGAIHPKEGFEYAYQQGADFICAGMFDFQVQEDTVIAKNILSSKLDRKRPWRG